MIYKNFKNLLLPSLGVGTMRLPTLPDGTVDEEACREMFSYAMEHGVNYFDTAYGYHNGKSEEVCGKLLSAYPRESYYLTTKFPGYDLSNMNKVEEIFEEQLKKCRTDYFDFYLFHNVYERNVDPYLDPKYGILEYLLNQKENGRKIDVTDRAAQMDDEVTINFEGFVDDVAFEGGKGENYKLTLGSHSFIDTFEDQIVGKNIGDKFDVNVTFPEEYHVEDLKGKPAVFKVELLAISTLELPELDDEFASDVSSFETFAEYKEDKKKTLEVKKEEQAKREKQSKVVEKIAEAAEVEIPEAMIKYNQERIMNEMSQRMMYQGLQMEQYLQLMGTTKEEFLERVKPDAIARIKTSLVLEAVAAAENIVASDDDVDAEIQDMATQYQMKPEELKDMIGAPELENIKKDIASRKALEFLGENCKEV